MNLEDIYTDLIAEHSRSTENRRHLEHASLVERGHNPSCGDEITLELSIKDGRIEDAAFTGAGCAISQASTDMMIELLRGQPVEEAQRLANLFIDMIKGNVIDEDLLESELDEAASLKNISTMPARVKCATLAWHTLLTSLDRRNDDRRNDH